MKSRRMARGREVGADRSFISLWSSTADEFHRMIPVHTSHINYYPVRVSVLAASSFLFASPPVVASFSGIPSLGLTV